MNAVVLLSGGLDSATALAAARREGFHCYCLSFDYGQRHRRELFAAERIARSLGAREHLMVRMDFGAVGGSALTDAIEVPKGRDERAMASGIPVTYVPARNMVFLSVAVGLAETRSARDLFIGVNAIDYSGYPDCRPQFIEAFEHAANLGTKAGIEGQGVRIRTPLAGLTKAQIIRLGIELGVDYSLTHSCYDPDDQGSACGSCDSCIIRRRGFVEAGIPDPTTYAPA